MMDQLSIRLILLVQNKFISFAESLNHTELNSSSFCMVLYKLFITMMGKFINKIIHNILASNGVFSVFTYNFVNASIKFIP